VSKIMAEILNIQDQAYIAGAWAALPRTFAVVSPATGETLAQVADCGPAEARQAVDAAASAFATWRSTTVYERAATIQRWHDLVLEYEAELGRMMAQEMGKPISEARGEVRYAASFISWYAEETKRLNGDIVPSQFTNKRLLVSQQPVGPVVAITPWNFPAAMITRKAAPALAAGCTIIIKPAEQSPLMALALAQLWQEAGGPPSTLQVLPTSNPAPVGTVLLDDERIRKLTFTGSTEVGRQLYVRAAASLKHVSLELGGHAPFLIFADADLDAAVREVLGSKFRNAGQTCVCANRIYVHETIRYAFAERLAAAVAALRMGDPLDPATQIGPLVDAQGLAKVEAHVADALTQGAQLLTGGQRQVGLYYQPTVLTEVRPGMRLMVEETFGPVAPLLTFHDEDEAIVQANATPYGLAAYLWTRDLSRAFRVAESLDYGIVGINDGLPSTPQAPFGGVKNSGLGREGGRWGIAEYLEPKYLSIAL
jgi:succinate-semialdehyde dehydrogenase/glutarate-semialdehyde dehydrogenase